MSPIWRYASASGWLVSRNVVHTLRRFLSDKRTHRGPNPKDRELFAPAEIEKLYAAVTDLAWLLNRGYAEQSSLKLVGDRFALRERQRTAVMRCTCTDAARDHRCRHECEVSELAGRTLVVDGYNVLTTVEAALAGGVLLLGRDGCLRDMASMHGTFRRVEETGPAVRLLGREFERLAVAECLWLLDRPVSNSGRLERMLQAIGQDSNWNWTTYLVPDPDRELVQTDAIVASADSVVLDGCDCWFNLAHHTVERHVPHAWIVDLSDTCSR